MPLTDVLITDYSSIFFDFLLLDRPIVFLTHDLEQYLEQDQGYVFRLRDHDAVWNCRNQDELEETLAAIRSNQGSDGQAEVRERIRCPIA